MNATQKSVILSATHETQDGDIPICPQCGKTVIQRTGHKKKFCSDRCRMDYWNSHQERVSRKAYYSPVCKKLRSDLPLLQKRTPEILLPVLL